MFKRSKDLRKGGTQCIFIEKIDQRENDTSLFFSTNNNIDGCLFPKNITRHELNPQPPDSESSALPPCYYKASLWIT